MLFLVSMRVVWLEVKDCGKASRLQASMVVVKAIGIVSFRVPAVLKRQLASLQCSMVKPVS